MCTESFDVNGFETAREAYEVREYLRGVPNIETVDCNVLSKSLTIEYDESELDHEDVLDEIEHAGCTPSERQKGFFGRVRDSVA